MASRASSSPPTGAPFSPVSDADALGLRDAANHVAELELKDLEVLSRVKYSSINSFELFSKVIIAVTMAYALYHPLLAVCITLATCLTGEFSIYNLLNIFYIFQ